jgi:hypothetical protein
MANELDGIYNAGLDACRTGAIRVAICSAQPANYAGIAAVTLGEATISSADFAALADNTPSGRKVVFNGKAGVVPTGNGTALYLAFHNNVDILYATPTVTSQAITTSQTWDIPSCTLGILDPA